MEERWERDGLSSFAYIDRVPLVQCKLERRGSRALYWLAFSVSASAATSEYWWMAASEAEKGR